jgi:5-methylcytosine-specific restriction endonuclease McrA
MIRNGRKYPPEEVLPFVIFDTKAQGACADQLGYRKDYDGDKINMSSDRLKVFAKKGCKCVLCGIEGTFFAKEKAVPSESKYHFNLYAVTPEGEEILMTKDHIVSKKAGGSDSLDNYQPMCYPCNFAKGHS